MDSAPVRFIAAAFYYALVVKLLSTEIDNSRCHHCRLSLFITFEQYFFLIVETKAAAFICFLYLLQVALCGKPFTSHQTSTQRMKQPVSTHTSASARRTTWPSTILHCSSISRGTHPRPRRWLLTPSRTLTPSWLWWRRPRRPIRGRWSLWRASYPRGTWCGSPGCSPAAPHSPSSVSSSRMNRAPLGYNRR